jgi:hypothetical protein
MEDLNQYNDSFEAGMQGMFSGLEQTADAHVWNNIEAALKQKSNRIIAWWWWGSAAAVVLGAVLSVSLFNGGSNYEPRISNYESINDLDYNACLDSSVQEWSNNPFENTSEDVDQIEPSSIQESNIDPTGQFAVNTITDHLPRVVDSEEGQKDKVVKTSYNDSPESIDKMSIAGIELAWNTDSLTLRDERIIKVYDEDKIDWQDWDEKNFSDWGIAANLGSSNSTEQSTSTFGYQSEGLTTQDNSMEFGLSDQRATVQELTYLSPFVVGVRGNWRFAKRWSIESGLSYSLLPTVGESFTNGEKRVNRYNDHFIGIPILNNFNVIDRKRFALYMSQGAFIEKGIASRNTITTYQGSEVESKQISKEPTQGWQIGASVGAGAQYKINETWSLFIEPRVTSWLLNINVQDNIRNRQAIWPTIDLGVRLNLD